MVDNAAEFPGIVKLGAEDMNTNYTSNVVEVIWYKKMCRNEAKLITVVDSISTRP